MLEATAAGVIPLASPRATAQRCSPATRPGPRMAQSAAAALAVRPWVKWWLALSGVVVRIARARSCRRAQRVRTLERVHALLAHVPCACVCPRCPAAAHACTYTRAHQCRSSTMLARRCCGRTRSRAGACTRCACGAERMCLLVCVLRFWLCVLARVCAAPSCAPPLCA